MPNDFYDMEIEDSALMLSGWVDQDQHEQLIYRTMTVWIVSAMQGGKVGQTVRESWPLESDKKKGTNTDFLKDKLARRKQAKLKSVNGSGNKG